MMIAAVTGPMPGVSWRPGASSPAYAANVPGFYIFGCLYHYSSEEHRDIIIVQ